MTTKQDYLWDKTGEDAEIERLENALAAFRCKEIAPLALPAKVLPFRKEEPPRVPRRIFSFAAAVAACVLFAVILLGVRLQLSNNNAPLQANLTQKAEPEIQSPQQSEQPLQQPRQDAPVISKKADLPVDNPLNPKRFSAARGNAATRRNPRPAPAALKISLRTATAARKAKVTPASERLTKEEQYAYDQLMLALSIASSKFKLVRDKIDGAAEEKKAALESGQ